MIRYRLSGPCTSTVMVTCRASVDGNAFLDRARCRRVGCECLPITGSSGPRGCSCSRSTSSSRSATSSATSRRAASALVPHSWGFTEIEFEARFAEHRQGRRCGALAGVFPDGTPFRMPDDDPLPKPIDIGAGRPRSDRCISPCRCAAPASSTSTARRAPDELVRHDVREVQARNDASSGGDPALLEVGALRTRLLLASEVTAGLRLRAAGPRRRMPRRQAGRPRRELHSDRPARARPPAGWRPSPPSCSGCCISAAKRSPGASRRPAGAPRRSSPTS